MKKLIKFSHLKITLLTCLFSLLSSWSLAITTDCSSIIDKGNGNLVDQFGLKINFEKVFSLCKEEAEDGSAIAQTLIGISQDIKGQNSEALKWYELAAEQGNPRAEFYIGNIYSFGDGVKRDNGKALKWYNKSAKKNDFLAQYNLGILYLEGIEVPQNLKKAINYLTLSANQGYKFAQYDLGLLHLEGKVIEQDDQKAFSWFMKSAQQGHKDSKFYIGMMYSMGIGISQDLFKAINMIPEENLEKNVKNVLPYLRSAADKGEPNAQYNLGLILSNSNNPKGLELLKKSAKKNNPAAQIYLSILNFYGSEGVPKNEKKAFDLAFKSAKQGNTTAQAHVARSYYEGLGTKIDKKKAFNFYLLAAQQGHSISQSMVGYMYKYGIGVSKSYNLALKWLKEASLQNDMGAHFEIGRMFLRAEGLNRDFERAFDYLKYSADLGHHNSQNDIGNAYCYGVGIERNEKKAEKYYKLASNNGNMYAKRNLVALRSESTCRSSTNPKEDFKLNLESAKKGYAPSMTALGLAYMVGDGVEKHFEESVKWFKLASKNGEDRATEILNYLNLSKSVSTTNNAYELNLKNLLQEFAENTKTPYEELFKLSQDIIKVSSEKKAVNTLDINKFGTYHALVIGNNDYRNLRKLKTAVFDAETIEKILRDNFGFKTKLLKNSTRSEILDNLYQYRKTLSEDDNLLIYYAGHGYLDKEINKGYWQPVDADPDRKSNWISNADVVDELRAIKAKHILLVADSCFAGSLTRGVSFSSKSENIKQDWIEKIRLLKTRRVLTSGNLEPVTDEGFDGHSVFAYHFIKALNNVDDLVTGDEIFFGIKNDIQLNADQTPLYDHIKNVGSKNEGDFIFVKRNGG